MKSDESTILKRKADNNVPEVYDTSEPVKAVPIQYEDESSTTSSSLQKKIRVSIYISLVIILVIILIAFTVYIIFFKDDQTPNFNFNKPEDNTNTHTTNNKETRSVIESTIVHKKQLTNNTDNKTLITSENKTLISSENKTLINKENTTVSKHENTTVSKQENNTINEQEINEIEKRPKIELTSNYVDELMQKTEKKEYQKYSCEYLDPHYIFTNRLRNTGSKKVLCRGDDSEHVCYYNDEFSHFRQRRGVICFEKNLILDTSKWQDSNVVYNGPSGGSSPHISSGFFSMNCNKEKNSAGGYNGFYYFYFRGWGYDNNAVADEELAPGKTVFLMGRNQDSYNIYHGFCEFINTFSMMYVLGLNPENIQIVFYDSMINNNDTLLDLYSNVISRGGKPIFVRDLSKTKKKYLIKNALSVPINCDSPFFIPDSIPMPTCTKQLPMYKDYLKYVLKYMNVTEFFDSPNYDNTTILYPKNYDPTKNYTKFITIQNRQNFPRTRKNQLRIITNGPEILEAVSKVVAPNVLVRLVDTGRLPMQKQISIMRKTDYFIGIHGAGLTLIMFAKEHVVLHEIWHTRQNHLLLYMCAWSSHKFFSDNVKNVIDNRDNEYVTFDANDFARVVSERLKEINF